MCAFHGRLRALDFFLAGCLLGWPVMRDERSCSGLDMPSDGTGQRRFWWRRWGRRGRHIIYLLVPGFGFHVASDTLYSVYGTMHMIFFHIVKCSWLIFMPSGQSRCRACVSGRRDLEFFFFLVTAATLIASWPGKSEENSFCPTFFGFHITRIYLRTCYFFVVWFCFVLLSLFVCPSPHELETWFGLRRWEHELDIWVTPNHNMCSTCFLQ